MGTSDKMLTQYSRQTKCLNLSNHALTQIPSELQNFNNLESLNLSKNQLQLDSTDAAILTKLSPNLKELVLHSNQISAISKSAELALTRFPRLEKLDISGNKLTDLTAVTRLARLSSLQASGNELRSIPAEIVNMQGLEYLYLGNNKLTTINPMVSRLAKLKLLALNNNRISRIPEAMVNLGELKTLHLHYNEIAVIPAGLVKCTAKTCHVQEITLRGNPLLDKFVKSRLMAGIKHTTPTLFELAARAIKEHRLDYDRRSLPDHINRHLETAVNCANPACHGVYFESKYLQVKFVDCCGAYRVPLLQYLCSPTCLEVPSRSRSESESTSSGESESEREFTQGEIDYYHRRVVLTGVDERFSGFS